MTVNGVCMPFPTALRDPIDMYCNSCMYCNCCVNPNAIHHARADWLLIAIGFLPAVGGCSELVQVQAEWEGGCVWPAHAEVSVGQQAQVQMGSRMGEGERCTIWQQQHIV